MTDGSNHGVNRRDSAKLLAAGVLAAGVMSGPAGAEIASAEIGDAAALEAAFRAAFAAAAHEPRAMATARLALLDDAALVIDHDIPFPLDRAAYADHLAFHAGSWARLETRLVDVRIAVHGSTGIASAYFMQRGKPVDSGYRLRAGYCTAVCVRDARGWRALGLHLAPLAGQIIDASPG